MLFEDTFYDDGNGESNLDPTSNYNVSFKLIDRVENNASVDYIYSGEETNFTIAREDEKFFKKNKKRIKGTG